MQPLRAAGKVEGNQEVPISAPLFPPSVLTPASPIGYLVAESEPRQCGPRARPRAESGEVPVRPHCPVRFAVLENRHLACVYGSGSAVSVSA